MVNFAPVALVLVVLVERRRHQPLDHIRLGQGAAGEDLRPRGENAESLRISARTQVAYHREVSLHRNWTQPAPVKTVPSAALIVISLCGAISSISMP